MEFKKAVFAAAATALNFLFGGVDSMFVAFVIFVVIDYLTGLMAAIVNKSLSSEIGIKGTVRR